MTERDTPIPHTRDEHVLFVHAHPDDESIETGGTIAYLIDSGTGVTVVTATRGERGDVIPDDLSGLRADGSMLGRHREAELRAAMRALGVTDHRFLGSEDARAPGRLPRRYLDSGMRWGADGNPLPLEPLDPHSLCAADPHEVALDVLEVILATRATAIITYNDFGGYGHPDHIAVHRASVRAARAADVPVFVIEYPQTAASASLRAVTERGRFTPPSQHETTVVPDESVTTAVDASAQLPRKVQALRAHRSQVVVDEDQYGLSNGTGELIRAVETFRLLDPAGMDSAEMDSAEPTTGQITDDENLHGAEPGDSSGDAYSPPLLHRILGYALAGVIGCAFGAIATMAHRIEIALAGLSIPIGLVLGITMVIALLVGFRLVLRDRYYVGAAAGGILLALFVYSLPGAGGSALFPQSATSVVWTFAPGLIAAVVIAWPRLPERRA